MRICFPVDAGWHLDRCVKFAMDKRAQTLDLDPESIIFFGGLHMLPTNLDFTLRFRSLTVLRLASVNITREVLGHLLSCCLNLEVLCVKDSTLLVHLKVSRPSLRLRYLTVGHCLDLEASREPDIV